MLNRQPSETNAGAQPRWRQGTDLRSYLRLLIRRRWLFLIVALGTLAAVVGSTLLMTPTYSATVRLQLERLQPNVLAPEQMVTGEIADSAAVDTEVEVLQSFSLLRKVVDRLQLERHPLFRTETPVPIEPRRTQIARALGKDLDARRIGTTYLIEVSYSSPSATLAAEVSNAVARTYLDEQLRSKLGDTQDASRWLNSRLSGLRSQVLAAEAAVQRYKAQHGLLSAEGKTLTEQEISNLNTQLAAARAAEAEQRAKLDTARAQLARGSSGDDVGEALGSDVVQQLRQQMTTVRQMLADLRGRYGPKHPDIQKAQRQLRDIENEIRAEIRRIISNLEAQSEIARKRTASIEASLAGVRSQLAVNNDAAVRLAELERNAESVRALYQSFLDRFKQTTAQQGIEKPSALIQSAAVVPSWPNWPNIPYFLIIGTVLGMVLGLLAVIFKEALDTSLVSTEDVEEGLGVAALGQIPMLASTIDDRRLRHMAPEDFVVAKPLSAFAEAFRALKVSLTPLRAAERPRVVAITSALPDEGKTTTAFCLARTAALGGTSVIVVDCDDRRQGLTRLAGRTPPVGLIEVLRGEARLQDAKLRDEATDADLLLMAEGTVPTENPLANERFDALLAELRRDYEMVILDTPPLLPAADARVIAAKADAAVLICRWRKTARDAAITAIRQLMSAGAPLWGAVLTQVDVREQVRAGYGDSIQYARSYRHYYQ